MTTAHPVIMVGFAWVAVAAIGVFQPDASVILIEEPGTIRKGHLRSRLKDAAVIREVVGWDYRRAGTADEFFNAHPDLAPAAIAPAVEYATPFAARLAERYGLPGAGLGAAELLRDKSVLRRVTRAAGIPNPESQSVSSADEVRAFMAGHPGAAILKPADRVGSLGTHVLRSADDIDAVWAQCVTECRTLDVSVSGSDRPADVRMLVERFVQGREFSVELLVSAGRTLFGNVTETELYPGPRPVERGKLAPADIPEELERRLRDQTEAVVRTVGFGTGLVCCEWIVEAGTPYLVECAGRLPGDFMVDLIEWAYDTELFRAYWGLHKGEIPTPSLPRRAGRFAAVRFLHAGPGVVESVGGLKEAYAVPDVIHCGFMVEPGTRTYELRHSMDCAAFAISCAATPDEAVRRAEEAVGRLRITMRPSSGTHGSRGFPGRPSDASALYPQT
ncbi:ATP-grasp domain-containing protein [Actinacidiphila glaucinigra]|uniref:ATP-grasp domain-containing protein n=1 Tax=Actinacidiphila glaucinigra TaxID=235986 RepID=UPI002DD9150D|nr:ATP-grasp domain-containing protein [Actinacidiphila glaucinigra]WSD57755.1 ATP-grasp domain-containing protein [Actinacidiphila glaucinigra]